MTKKKPPQVSTKREVSLVRSSAAEYLTFVAASSHGASRRSMQKKVSGSRRR